MRPLLPESGVQWRRLVSDWQIQPQPGGVTASALPSVERSLRLVTDGAMSRSPMTVMWRSFSGCCVQLAAVARHRRYIVYARALPVTGGYHTGHTASSAV